MTTVHVASFVVRDSPKRVLVSDHLTYISAGVPVVTQLSWPSYLIRSSWAPRFKALCILTCFPEPGLFRLSRIYLACFPHPQPSYEDYKTSEALSVCG